MANDVLEKQSMINLPVSLEQFAFGLRKLSRADLLTLEILLDKKAMKTIRQGIKEVEKKKIKEFRL